MANHVRPIVRPVRPQRPGANLLILTHARTLEDSRVERGWLDALLGPVNENSEARVRDIGSTVGCSRDEEEAVPVVERGGAFIKGHVWVHYLADGLVVVH